MSHGPARDFAELLEDAYASVEAGRDWFAVTPREKARLLDTHAAAVGPNWTAFMALAPSHRAELTEAALRTTITTGGGEVVRMVEIVSVDCGESLAT